MSAAPSPRPLTVVVTAVAYFMITLDALVVVTALPSIHEGLGGSAESLQWTINAYNVAFASGIITASAVGDRFGRRAVYLAGLALFTAASAACAMAPSLDALIAARAVQGIGAAIVMPLGLTLITSAFPAGRRGTVVGVWGGVAGLGVASGPLIGGAVTEGWDWHWIFWVNVPVGVAALVAARLVLAPSKGVPEPLDVPGLLLAPSGVGLAIWGMVQGPTAGWVSGRVVGALAAGFLLIVGFVVRQQRARHPMIPLQMFHRRTFSAAMLTTLTMSAAIYSAPLLMSEFFQLGHGVSPLHTGLRFLPWTGTPLLIAPVAGQLFDRMGARWLTVPGLLMQAAGFVWIAALVRDHSGWTVYVAPFVLAGVGISMALPCVASAGMNAVPPSVLGRASGSLNSMQLLGAAFGVAIVTAVFDANGALTGSAAVVNGVRPALLTAAAISAVGAAAALGLQRTRATHASDPSPTTGAAYRTDPLMVANGE